MFTLAHAHGTMIALVQLAFAATMRERAEHAAALARAASCLRWAGILLPCGFLFGGVQILGADPGYAIALVPIGAVCLILGVAAAARMAAAGDAAPELPPAPPTAPAGDRKQPPAKPR